MNIWQSHIDNDKADFLLVNSVIRVSDIIFNSNYFSIYYNKNIESAPVAGSYGTQLSQTDFINVRYDTIKECRMKRLELVQMWRNT